MIGSNCCEMLKFSNALEVNRTLQTIDLSNNNIDSASLWCIGTALKVNRSLRSINLSANKFGRESLDLYMFREALKANKSLWSIDLSNIDLDFYGIELLANALEYNQSLKEVNLSGNKIGGGYASIFIANVLRGNRILQKIDLSNNNIDDKDVETIVAALKSNCSLNSKSI